MIALYVEGQSTTKKVTCLGAIPIVTVEIEPSGWTLSPANLTKGRFALAMICCKMLEGCSLHQGIL
jgi:hypothetical protein